MEQNNEAEPRKGLSFGFFKKKETGQLGKSVIKEEDKDAAQKPDFVTSLEDQKVKSTRPTEEAKPLVIPLITQNKWKLPTPEDLEKNGQSAAEDTGSSKYLVKTGDDITDQAVQELVTEANKEQEKWNQGDQSGYNETIPLLARNKVPDGFETDDKLDVSLRPNEPAVADYDQVPISEYGKAMLRGMLPAGKTLEDLANEVSPVDAIVRPKGMGLGADKSLVLQQKGDGKGSKGQGHGEKLEMKRGAFCVVVAGKNEGLYGMVEGMDEDNARVVIKLTLSGAAVSMSQIAIQLVTKTDYDKNSKYLNKSKVDKFKEEESRKEKNKGRSSEADDTSGSEVKGHSHKHKKHRHSDRESEHDRHRYKDRHRHRHDKDDKRSDKEDRYGDYKCSRDGSHRSKRHRSRSPIREEAGKRDRRSPIREEVDKKRDRRKDKDRSESANKKKGSSSWLRPQIQVRVIDQKYKKGSFYLSKVIIEDVISLDACVCRSADGKLLEGLSQSQLETVIPKSDSQPVIVVSGPHKGKVGEIIQRDKSKCTTFVQVMPDREEVIMLGFDVICTYTGNIDDLQ